MNDEAIRFFGPLGAEVMEVLWAAGSAMTVREVLDALNRDRSAPLAYTTVMTVLTRLADKGALRRTQRGRSYAYEPVAADTAGIAVRSVLEEFGDAAVAHFVEQVSTDPDAQSRLQRLLDEE